MVALNLTIFVEMVLFLLFLWGARRVLLRPVINVMEERQEVATRNESETVRDNAEADAMEAEQKRLVIESHQVSTQRTDWARYMANLAARREYRERRRQADYEVMLHRAKVAQHLAAERNRLEGLLPGLVEEVDRQVRSEGRLF